MTAKNSLSCSARWQTSPLASTSPPVGHRKHLFSPEEFQAQAPGVNMVLENHQVRISAEPRIHEGAKYYMVDIVVGAIYHSPNPIDLIKDIIPSLKNQPDERPHNARLSPSHGFGRIKSAFKFS
jgi:hypothetical protein